MMSKKIISIIAITIMITLLAGVSSVLAADEVTISFTWWGDTARHEIYNSIADMFEEEYPNIKVDRQPGSWTQYWDKLATTVASGNPPDVVGMHPRYAADYIPRGAILDLTPYIESGVLAMYNIPKAVADTGVVNGKQYMVAQGVTMTGYIYNTATLDELGVSYPEMDWTYEDFAEKVVESTEAAQAKGIEMWGSADDSSNFIPQFAYFARSKGETAYTDEGKLGFTEETVVEWFYYWKELRDKGAIPDPATTVEYTGLPLEQNLFNTGKIAISTIPANQLWLFQEQVKNSGKLNMIRLPHLKDGKPGEYIEGAQLAVTSGSKHPEAAAKFISFFYNDKEAQELFKLEQGVPPTTTAQEVIADILTEPDQKTTEFVAYALGFASPAPNPPTGSTEVIAYFEETAQAVAYGYLTPEAGAADFMQTANDILSMSN